MIELPFTPTPQQADFFDHCMHVMDRPNAVVLAVAGSGKTTSLVWGSKMLPSGLKVIFLAFNKHIAKELQGKLAKGIAAKTMHAVGYASIMRRHPEAKLNDNKAMDIIMPLAKQWSYADQARVEAKKRTKDTWKYALEISKMVSLARLTLTFKPEYLVRLAERYELEHFNEDDATRVLKVLERMAADTSTFDYTDMVYLPATNKQYVLPSFDVVFIDESQDLSMAQIRVAMRLKGRRGKFIAVGDPFQNIMSFAGTSDRSFQFLREQPDTIQIPLTVSFRCPTSHIALAARLNPEIMPAPWAEEGEIRVADIVDEVRDGDWVLCRRNGPLLRIFIELLKDGRKSSFNGRDYEKELKDFLEPVRHYALAQLKAYMDSYLNELKSKLRQAYSMDNPEEHDRYQEASDKVEVIGVLIPMVNNVEGILHLLENIFKHQGEGAILSSVHKSKGMEADRVFLLRPDLMQPKGSQGWIIQQEKHLKYVAYTRAKKGLYFDHNWVRKNKDGEIIRRADQLLGEEMGTVQPVENFLGR